MSTFSDKNFSSDSYDRARPSYPPEFLDVILKYHGSSHDTALDIGCGTGQITFPLAKHFDKVIGTDLSPVMIKKCIKKAEQLKQSNQISAKLDFFESPAELISPVESGTVDLITAAQCAHWFDHSKFYKEAARLLKPNGTLAYWTYADPVILKNLTTGEDVNVKLYNELYNKYTYDDPQYLGPYWENPGRKLLRNLYQDFKIPLDLFKDVEVDLYKPLESPTPGKLMVEKQWTLADYEDYVRLWSCYHKYLETFPNRDPEEIPKLFSSEFQKKLNIGKKDVLRVVWQTGVYLAKKR